MRVIGVIPARMGSSRFPGKPLARIHGVPMVGHVYFRSKMSRALQEVYLATCDEPIRAYAEQIGAPCILTAATHERAVDRTVEANATVEAMTGRRSDIIVMIQGDEPMVRPEMIDEAVAPLLADPAILLVNLTAPLKDREEHADPNAVKVVMDQAGDALYFSREPIPSWKKGAAALPMWKQVCIMPFRRDFLVTFGRLPQTPLERAESVDMLRALEHGYRVRMVPTRHDTYCVDTPEDLARAERKMAKDPLVARYQQAAGAK